MFLDVDAAVEVPVCLMPLIDDTDFKTRETAVAYNAAGMDLVWNFVTSAGVVTQTAVTPTSGGVYDWTHKGDGIYAIEIPASGGGSINNDTEGYGWFSGVATGVLPWRGPTVGFRAATLNNALCDGDGLSLIAASVWDRVITGANHNINNSAGKRLREITNSIVTSGTAQGGGTASITLAAGASSTDGTYDPAIVRISGGTGVGQARLIIQYVGSTRVASVDRDWRVTPDNTSEYEIVASQNLISTNEGLAQGGGASTITLNASASATDNVYVGQTVALRTGTGQDQSRIITAYNGTTKVATVATAWETNPAAGTGYILWPLGRSRVASVESAAITAIQSGLASQTSVDDLPTNAELATALGTADDAVLSALTTVDTVVDAIKVVTDQLADTLEDDGGTYRFTANALEEAPAGGSGLDAAGVRAAIGLASANLDTQLDALPTNAELSTALASADDAVLAAIDALPTATENADALLNRDMSAVSDTNARTPLNALRFLRNKWDVAGTTLTVKKEDDSTTAWTSTVTAAPGADPISGNDPA
jgi:hypothetical protein